MNSRSREIEFAIEVFVRGHSAGKSRTFPYEAKRVRPLWVMRDAARGIRAIIAGGVDCAWCRRRASGCGARHARGASSCAP